MSIEIRDLGGILIWSWYTRPIEQAINLPPIVGSLEWKLNKFMDNVMKEFDETFEVIDGEIVLKVKVEEIKNVTKY
jgi:hypothetical protein